MLAKFLNKTRWVWTILATSLLLWVGLVSPVLIARVVDLDGPMFDWVEIPAPEGSRLQCWERRGNVVCQERSEDLPLDSGGVDWTWN